MVPKGPEAISTGRGRDNSTLDGRTSQFGLHCLPTLSRLAITELIACGAQVNQDGQDDQCCQVAV